MTQPYIGLPDGNIVPRSTLKSIILSEVDGWLPWCKRYKVTLTMADYTYTKNFPTLKVATDFRDQSLKLFIH